MTADSGTYASLVELQGKRAPRKTREPASVRPPHEPEVKKPELPRELENVARVGYVSHSFRLTTAEKVWLDSFCFQLSARLDRRVTHNNLVRILMRLADNLMRRRPDNNELLDKLLEIKD
jgi:hypothetical protein